MAGLQQSYIVPAYRHFYPRVLEILLAATIQLLVMTLHKLLVTVSAHTFLTTVEQNYPQSPVDFAKKAA